jgi:hypothetical protein
MPGRPRMCLKRLTTLLENVQACGNDLFNLMPSQYRERPDPDDPICAAWRICPVLRGTILRSLERRGCEPTRLGVQAPVLRSVK